MTDTRIMLSNAPKFWWKKEFGKTYYNLYNPVLSHDRSVEEVRFIIKTIPLKNNAKILDLGCGHGRHTIELAKQHFNITGLDYSDYFLKIAKNEAKKQQIHVPFIKQDMRQMKVYEEYDTILSMYSAFGYFPHEENIDVLRRVFAALKPGGKFLIDIINAYNHVSFIKTNGHKLRDGVYKYIHTNTVDGYKLIDTDIYFENSQLDSYHRKWSKGNKKGYFHYYMTQYTLEQYKRLLEDVGFEIQNLYGEYNGKYWNKKSWRTIILSSKPENRHKIHHTIEKFINFSVLHRWPKVII